MHALIATYAARVIDDFAARRRLGFHRGVDGSVEQAVNCTPNWRAMTTRIMEWTQARHSARRVCNSEQLRQFLSGADIRLLSDTAVLSVWALACTSKSYLSRDIPRSA